VYIYIEPVYRGQLLIKGEFSGSLQLYTVIV